MLSLRKDLAALETACSGWVALCVFRLLEGVRKGHHVQRAMIGT